MSIKDELKAKYGEPAKETKVASYIKAHFDEIKEALDKGYQKKQVASLISEKLGNKVNPCTFHYYYKKCQALHSGCWMIEYNLGDTRQRVWREFGSREAAERWVEEMGKKASAKAGYKVKATLIKMKPMTREEYQIKAN